MTRNSPFHLLAKPTGSACNLDCQYCFFLSKGGLYPGSNSRMSRLLLETYVRQLLAAQPDGEVNVAWQGGEPTLIGLEFFRDAVELVEKYRRPGQAVLHSLQTNGLLIDDEWAEFLSENRFLVGLSIDGPQEMHDAYRVDKRGGGSFQLVMRAWETLQRRHVDVNILCTVHAKNEHHGLAVYRFFRDALGARHLQFIPIVERTTQQQLLRANSGWSARPGGERPLYLQTGDRVTDRSVRPAQYGRFLIEIFDEWVRRDVGEVFVQSFDAALANWLGRPSTCIFSPECGDAVALEHNGDLYSCDHYVEPAYRLGNINETDLRQLVDSPTQRQFGEAKLNSLPRQCRECDVLFACYGECPRNRFIRASDGEAGLNYLCDGYKTFFKHIGPSMRIMADLLNCGRFAGDIMQI